MSEQFSQLMTKNSLSVLLDTWSKSSEFASAGLSIGDLREADFEVASPGLVIWSWGMRSEHDRLKKSYMYHDRDNIPVFVSLVFGREGYLKEVELWKGDGSLIRAVPDASRLLPA